MDGSLILYLIIFLVVVFLIFKIIKKVIFAIFAVIFTVVLVFAGIGGMMYFDYQDIIGRDNFDVNLVYGDLKNPIMGVVIPYEEEGIDVKNIVSLDVGSLNEEVVEEKSKDDFYVFISEDVFENVLDENDSYYLVGTEDLKISGVELDTSLSKKEVLEVLSSTDSNDKYIEFVVSKNDFDDSQVISDLESSLNEELSQVSVKELLFVSVITDLNKNVVSELVIGFKEDEVLVYPKKFSFKFLKMLPVDSLVKTFSFEDREEK